MIVEYHRQQKKSLIQRTFWYILRESWYVVATDIFTQSLNKLQVAILLSRGGQFQSRKIEQIVLPIMCIVFFANFREFIFGRLTYWEKVTFFFYFWFIGGPWIYFILPSLFLESPFPNSSRHLCKVLEYLW